MGKSLHNAPTMKLLMISGDRSLAQGKSGAFSSMLTEFAKHWERIDILSPRVSSPKDLVGLPSNVFLHPSTRSLFLQPWFIRQKGAELHRLYQYDVMTVHEYPPFYNGLGARLLKRATGIPMTMELHHLVGMPHAASCSELIGRWMTQLLIASHTSSFDAVRVVNSSVKHQLVAWGVAPHKIHIVPSVYLDHALVDITKNQKKVYDLVFAARLVDNKGLDSVLRAIAIVPTITLCVIGDGPCRSSAEKLVDDLGIRDRVTFTGWLPTSEDVAHTIASGKVFVMNSTSEGNPRSAVEAMAYGLPVITTPVGIMPDIVEEGSNSFFTDGRPESIAEAMRQCFSSTSLQELGINAQKSVLNRYEKSSAIRAYATFLYSVAALSKNPVR